MARLGARFAPLLKGGLVIALSGTLGAGKTTLVRAILRALGHAGSVKSPTYTLVESYSVAGMKLHHFDFYRLADPDELEGLGVRDYLGADAVCLIEWPERGGARMPAVDVRVRIMHNLLPSGSGREIEIEALTAAGQALVDGLGW